MNRLLLIPLITVIMTVTNDGASAVYAKHRCRSTCVKCPRCQGCCKLDISEAKESKHYWTVETEQICVPNIVFPWQNRGLNRRGAASCGCGAGCAGGCSAVGCTAGGCSGGCGSVGCGAGGCGAQCRRVAHNGARVITICKPKKNSYECPTCEYEWSVDDGGSRCSRNCAPEDDSEADGEEKASTEESTPEVAPAESPEPPVEAPVEVQAAFKPAAKLQQNVKRQRVVKPQTVRRPTRQVTHQAPVVPQPQTEVAAPPEPTSSTVNFSIIDPFSRPSVFDSYRRVAGQP